MPEGNAIQNTKALAEHLGISRWTVSRVLNGHPGVHPETRQKIERAMAEFGFAPNPMARGLRGRRSGLIGICLHELDNPVLSSKAMALQRFLRGRGYHALLELTGSERSLEPIVLQSFLSVKVEGIILVASRLRPEDAIVSTLQRAATPVVALDPFHDLPFPTVRLDRVAALKRLTEEFLRVGHQRIALAGISERSEYGRDRITGVRDAMAEAGLDAERNLVFFEKAPGLSDSVFAGFELAERILAAREFPQAIIAGNDRTCLGLMQRFRAAGKQAPTDFSIAGFDNLEAGLCCSPALTTVDQEIDSVIEATVQRLTEILSANATPKPPDTLLIEPLIVRRESIAAPGAGGARCGGVD